MKNRILRNGKYELFLTNIYFNSWKFWRKHYSRICLFKIKAFFNSMVLHSNCIIMIWKFANSIFFYGTETKVTFWNQCWLMSDKYKRMCFPYCWHLNVWNIFEPKSLIRWKIKKLKYWVSFNHFFFISILRCTYDDTLYIWVIKTVFKLSHVSRRAIL